MPPIYRCRLFLFDLDGTLVDSREDIARALNSVLARMGLSCLSMEDVLCFVGDGVEALIRRALLKVSGVEPGPDRVRQGMQFMVQEYDLRLIDSTRLYPGVRETLAALAGACLALISNKPEKFSRRILEAFGIADRFCLVLGGDSLPERKPHPAPLLEAMSLCRALPSETVMVGDSPADILAGKAAGAITCGVCGGFRPRADLEAAGSDLIIDRFPDLLQHFAPKIGVSP